MISRIVPNADRIRNRPSKRPLQPGNLLRRYSWIGVALLGFANIGLPMAPMPAAKPKPRPLNFVFIVADDMNWNDCGAFGNKRIRTPNLDKLARDGMRFDAAFLTCSSCSPSRASILTGRYPHCTGASELNLPLPADQKLVTEPLRAAGYYAAAAGKWHLGPAARAKFDMVKEGGGPGGYADWLPVLTGRPKNKPFFIWLSANDPHRPYQPNTIPQPHKPSDVVLPPYLPDAPEVRADMAAYYDEITRLDTQVGLVLAELERQGEASNTLVVFLSDNGRPFPRCKTTLFDDGVRTPLLMRLPGRIAKGGVCTSLVSAVDLAPTVLELARLPGMSSAQGVSLAALLGDPSKSVHTYVYAEHNWHDYMARERSIRSTDYLLVSNDVTEQPRTPPADTVRSPTYQLMRQWRDADKLTRLQASCFDRPLPSEELYDVRNDPEQRHNLATDPRYEDTLRTLRDELARWQEATGDVKPKQLRPDRYNRETGLGASAPNDNEQARRINGVQVSPR